MLEGRCIVGGLYIGVDVKVEIECDKEIELEVFG